MPGNLGDPKTPEGKWDVIHFNWGLHDLKVTADGGRQVPLEVYEKNLQVLVARLKKTGARLIWATTTPVPAGKQSPMRETADVAKYNAAARRVMDANGIGVDVFDHGQNGFVLVSIAVIASAGLPEAVLDITNGLENLEVLCSTNSHPTSVTSLINL